MIEFKKYLFLNQKRIKKIGIIFSFLFLFFLMIFLMINDKSQNFIANKITLTKNNILAFFDISYQKVNIIGIENSSEQEIRNIIANKTKNLDLQHLGAKIIKDIRLAIEQINWVKEVTINRNISSSLDIKIIEYSPFAILEKENTKYIINKDGILINVANINDFDHLVIVNGDNANLRINSLFNLFSAKPEIGQNIYSASWVGNRRWNIRFHNNILVKLPEKNIEKAWKKLEDIYNDENLMNNIKIIDLRVENKTFLKINDK